MTPDSAEGWRPIESAPKDGTRILAFVSGADGLWDHLNGRHFCVQHAGRTGSDYDLGWSVYPGLGGAPDWWFGGWQPLPEPPK
jgi:hypothetical protein